MKKAKNVDGRTKSYLPSMKRAVFVDGSPKTDVSSMKTAENVDDQPETDANQPSKQVLIVNYHQDAYSVTCKTLNIRLLFQTPAFLAMQAYLLTT